MPTSKSTLSAETALALEMALWAAGRGWAVAPIVPGQKYPPKGHDWAPENNMWGTPGYLAPDDVADKWPRRVCAVGILTGPSGLVDDDLDMDEEGNPAGAWALEDLADGRDIPHTFEIATPSGGRHLVWKAPRDREFKTCGGEIAPQFDVRGRGGLFVLWDPARPSRIILDGRDPVEMPAWLAELHPEPPGLGRAGARVPNANAWVKKHGDGDLCEIMEAELDKALRELERGDTHSAMINGVFALVGECTGGHTGLAPALEELQEAFHHAKRGKTREREWPEEWANALTGAIRKKGTRVAQEDPCEVLGGELVDPRVQMREDFWNSSRRLKLIRAWAQARMVSPMAALGEVLAEVVCHVPPYVQLPPLVGGNGTLNMLIALTGYSGTGKGVAAGVIAEAIECNVSMDMQRIPIGSGEGIPKAFGRVNHNRDTGLYELVRTFHSAVIEVKEIDTLNAIGSRVGGHTLTAQLNQFYSGEQLGFHYSDMKNRVIIPARSYRGCVVAGVQPGRGAVILDDTDSGFAQRWLWLPATDPDAPAEAPAVPGQTIKWSLPEDLLPEDFPWRPEPFIMDVCDKAVDQIRAARLPALRGETDGLDGHKLYTRLKVAAALALLEGYADVDEMDWDRAGYLIRISDSVRRRAEEELKRNAMKAAHVQGKMEGIRTSAAGDTAHKIAIERIGRKVMEIMPASDEWVSFGNGIKNKIAARDREMLPEAMANLVKTKKLEARNVTYRGQTGVQYRVATK